MRSLKLNEAMEYDRYENAKEATFFGWVFSNMRTYALLCSTWEECSKTSQTPKEKLFAKIIYGF